MQPLTRTASAGARFTMRPAPAPRAAAHPARLSVPSHADTVEGQGSLPVPVPVPAEDPERLGAVEDRVTALEGRVDRIEGTLQLPPAEATADGGNPTTTTAGQPATQLDARAIYARMSGQPAPTPGPAIAQSIDARAIYARHREQATARPIFGRPPHGRA